MVTMLCGISAEVQAGVVLGNTRVIYPSAAKEVTLALKNTEIAQAFLVKSTIENAEGEKQNNFVATPPLLILKPGGENKLRVFLKTSTPLAENRETLFWMSIMAVPSSERSEKGNFVQFAITNKIKLLYRPMVLGVPDEKTWEKINFRMQGDEVVVHNPTPYYMNIASFRTGNLNLESLTLAPGETQTIGLRSSAGRTAEVVFINDFGGESEKIMVPVT